MSTASAAPGRPQRSGRVGRPRLLSRDAVIEAALRLVDAQGLEALTIRQLADNLEVGTMTVYGYFAGKDELVQVMADALLARIAVPSVGEDPRVALVRFFTELHALCLDHPTLVNIFSATSVTGPAAHQRVDGVLSLLLATGLSGPEAVAAYRTITAYTLGFTLLRTRRDPSKRPGRSGTRRRTDAGDLQAVDRLGPLLDRAPTTGTLQEGLTRMLGAFVPSSATDPA